MTNASHYMTNEQDDRTNAHTYMTNAASLSCVMSVTATPPLCHWGAPQCQVELNRRVWGSPFHLWRAAARPPVLQVDMVVQVNALGCTCAFIVLYKRAHWRVQGSSLDCARQIGSRAGKSTGRGEQQPEREQEP